MLWQDRARKALATTPLFRCTPGSVSKTGRGVYGDGLRSHRFTTPETVLPRNPHCNNSLQFKPVFNSAIRVMADKWYVWIDQVPAEWATEDVPEIFANEGGPDGKTGWLPLVVCANESEADSVADALKIKCDKLVVYRNPLSEQDSLADAALIVDKANQLAWLAGHGEKYLEDWPPLFYVRLAIRLRNAVRRVARGGTLPEADSGLWSKPNGPQQWASIFGLSWDTLKRRFKAGAIRHKKLSSKSYQIHVDDLPQPEATARSSPQ